MNEIKEWREGYSLTIKVALLCVLLGFGVIFFFSGKWLTFWGILFVALGCVGFYFAHIIKSKHLNR